MDQLKGTSVKFTDYPNKLSKVKESDKKGIADNKSQTDNVLDLSDNDDLLAKELNNQKIDNIQFIKLKDCNNKDVILELDLTDSDATEIVNNLKEEILENGNIKDIFGGIQFSESGIEINYKNTPANEEELEQSLEGKSLKEQFDLVKNFVKLTHTPLNLIQDKLIQKNLKNANAVIDALKMDEWMAAKGLSPASLAGDLEAQIRLSILAKNTNKDLIKELSDVLKIPEKEFSGSPKEIDRIIDKMIKGEKSLGDIGDVTRARASFDKLDAEMIRKIETKFKDILETKFGKENVVWKSSLSETAKDYRGRVNIKIKLNTGMKFEFQMGSSQIDTLYKTHFNLLGGTTKTNIHDVFYKGVENYMQTPQNPALTKEIGELTGKNGKEVVETYSKLLREGKSQEAAKFGESLGKKGNKFLMDYAEAIRDFGSTKAGVKESEFFAEGEKMIEQSLKQIGGGDPVKGLKELESLKGIYSKNLDKVMQMADDGILLVNLKDPKLKAGQIKEFEELIKKGRAVDFPDFIKANGNLIEELDKVFAKVTDTGLRPKLLQRSASKAVDNVNLAPQVEKSLAEIKNLAKSSKLDSETVKALEKLAKDPNFLKDETAFNNLLSTVEKTSKEDPRIFKGFMETIKGGNPETLAKSFKEAKSGDELLMVARKMLPILETFSIKENATIIAKIGKGLSKALPVIGGIASAYDAVRLAGIATTGKDFSSDHDYNKYPAGDPRDTPENNDKLKDLRVLALVGAYSNTVDTLLAVVEVTGVGNIDLPVQLALCAAEIGIDIALEHFYEHPEQMPKEMSMVLKATALGMVATGVLNPPAAAAVLNIYGLAGTVDIANEFTKAAGEAGLSGAKFITDMQTQLLDKSMKGTAEDLHTLADMIRNPVKYAEKFAKSVEEIKEEAIQGLGNAIEKGGELAQKAYTELQTLMNDQIPEVAGAAWKAIKKGGARGLDFVVDGIKTGAIKVGDALQNLDEWKDQIIDKTIKLGSKAVDKLVLYAKDPSVAQKDAEAIVKGIARGIESGLIAIDKGMDYLLNAGEMGYEAVKDLISKGGKLAVTVYNKASQFMIKAGDKALEIGNKIGEGISELIDKGGEKAKEIVEAFAKDPVGFMKNCGDKAEEAVQKAALYLYNKAASGVESAVDSLKNLYDKTGKYLINLRNDVGAAIGRFDETLGELWKKGVGLKNEWIDKNIEIFNKNWPEIQKALSDVKDASKEQLVKMGNLALKAARAGVNGAIDFAQETYFKLAGKGKAALDEIVSLGNAIGSQVKDFSFKVADTLQELGDKGIERLKDIGNAGMLRLKVLAENATKLANQGNEYIQKSAEKAMEELKKIVDDPIKYGMEKYQIAKKAIILVAEKAIERVNGLNEKGIEFAKKAMQYIPDGPEAIEIARKALKKAEEFSGKALELGKQAIHNLREMGGKAIDTIVEYAQKTGEIAREAWKELKKLPDQAVEIFKEIIIKGGEMAEQALHELRCMGEKAINAIKEIILSGGKYADQAIEILKEMGGKAIDVLMEIAGLPVAYADKAAQAVNELAPNGIILGQQYTSKLSSPPVCNDI